MKILWVNKRNWKHPGPIVNMGVHNAHSFASIGHESHFCVGAGAASDTTADLQDFYQLTPLPNFSVHRISRAKRFGAARSSSVFKEATALTHQLLRQGQSLAIYTRESSFLLRLAWLRKRYGAQRIRTFYELHDWHADPSWRGRKPTSSEWREKWLERLLLPQLSGLICITQEMQKRYQNQFPRLPSIALPLGTKPQPETNPEQKRLARTLFYVGHMHGAKGVAFLEQAACALAACGVRTEFWGGYEKDANRINALAAERGLSQWIQAQAFQPPAALHAAMAERASLGIVMLADTYYNRYLTCPVKALDYLSHGVPALGTDIPSVREVLADSGLYVPEQDHAQFIQTVMHLLDDASTYATATRAARLRAAQITWSERARALVDFAESA
jgi:glycosyltransferase involved in cell wall biosynthesis